MLKRILLIVAALMLCVGAAVSESLTAPPLWLSEMPPLPERPEAPTITYEAGLLLVEGDEEVRQARLEYWDVSETGEQISYGYGLTRDETQGGWYSQEAAADPNKPTSIAVETDEWIVERFDGSYEELTLLEDGQPRYQWQYWLHPFEGLSMWDAPFMNVTIYPSADWPMETMYSGYGVLQHYIYTAPDGARVWYEADALYCVTLEKDGRQYAYTPSGGRYPKGWSVCTGDTSGHNSGYTPCEAPDGVSEANYTPLIDRETWLAAIDQAYQGR